MIMTLWGAVSASIVSAAPEKRSRQDGSRASSRSPNEERKYSLADYLAAFTARADIANAMVRFHEKYDLLLTPQMPIPALEAGRVTPADGSYGDNWINWSPYTYPFNLTQQPAASVPCGFSSDGLPIGLQIVGPARRDHLVLRAARAFESARPWPSSWTPRDKFDPFQTGIANARSRALGCAQAGRLRFATSAETAALDEWPPQKSLARDAHGKAQHQRQSARRAGRA